MAKSTSYYYCKECGTQSATWMGRCNACGAWNSFEQEVIHRDTTKKGKPLQQLIAATPKRLNEIAIEELGRISTTYSEFDNVLGGGIVQGSVVLLGGEPGIGKSTLLLQMALALSHKILYVSGEESEAQLKMRADRINSAPNPNAYFLTSVDTAEIIKHAQEMTPDIIIVDSIQTVKSPLIDSAAGSISQIKECAAELQQLAKTTNTPLFLVGHITKDGAIAGPKILEHIVDTVLQFEGDTHYGYRLVRCIKNRFGSTAELGIFEMSHAGLQQVLHPSELLISHGEESYSGKAIACVLEGSRPLMIETQALVSSAVYGTPQRSATGFDTKRMNMLLAVLEKRCQFKIGAKDVFLNIAGGIQVGDPAVNLSILAAILSSSLDLAIGNKTCFAAEVGLSGEIRPVPKIENRINEAEKLGFKTIYLSAHNLKGLDVKKYNINIKAITKIDELYISLVKEASDE